MIQLNGFSTITLNLSRSSSWRRCIFCVRVEQHTISEIDGQWACCVDWQWTMYTNYTQCALHMLQKYCVVHWSGWDPEKNRKQTQKENSKWSWIWYGEQYFSVLQTHTLQWFHFCFFSVFFRHHRRCLKRIDYCEWVRVWVCLLKHHMWVCVCVLHICIYCFIHNGYMDILWQPQ